MIEKLRLDSEGGALPAVSEKGQTLAYLDRVRFGRSFLSFF